MAAGIRGMAKRLLRDDGRKAAVFWLFRKFSFTILVYCAILPLAIPVTRSVE